ncbi:hypothetical protein TNIN_140761 [Trichonephila inaurata madagascariensis]|uniref:Uncharacterized protein n=1 Tax=Trichonephila inaurata madagascariensis TaxID=2747483 RepID=A0A8X6Y6E8_9ARAC|nr:hypothetical protein TNIN_140761 [Trichonephila inaurata madagascariensis]
MKRDAVFVESETLGVSLFEDSVGYICDFFDGYWSGMDAKNSSHWKSVEAAEEKVPTKALSAQAVRSCTPIHIVLRSSDGFLSPSSSRR